MQGLYLRHGPPTPLKDGMPPFHAHPVPGEGCEVTRLPDEKGGGGDLKIALTRSAGTSASARLSPTLRKARQKG